MLMAERVTECDPQCRMNILPSLMASNIAKKYNVPISQGA